MRLKYEPASEPLHISGVGIPSNGAAGARAAIKNARGGDSRRYHAPTVMGGTPGGQVRFTGYEPPVVPFRL